MDLYRRIDYDVFGPETLLCRNLVVKFLLLAHVQVHFRVYDREYLVIHIGHYEGAHSRQTEIEAINCVTLLIEISTLRVKLLLEARANPSHIFLVSQASEKDKLREMILMDLFTDLEAQVHGKLSNEFVKASIVNLIVILQRLPDSLIKLI